MSASRHISTSRSTSSTTRGTGRKSSPLLKSSRPRNIAENTDPLQPKRSPSVKNGITVDHGDSAISGFQGKRNGGHQIKSHHHRSKPNQKHDISSTRKQSPVQRRSSPASTRNSSASSKRLQKPPSKPDEIVFTNKDGDDAWGNGGRGDQVETRQSSGRIQPREIMEKCHETDVCKVYDIDLHACHIGSINNLDPFISLRVLDLSCNCIRNIENLANNKDMRDLKLYDNRLTAISNLERLPELCSLQLQHNKIRTIGKGLALARKLKTLRMDSNCMGKIEAREFAACAQLTYLDISTNKIDSLSALNALSSLEELRATHNCLRAVTDLKRCRKLQELDVSNNKITDISGLKGLHNLTVLRISHNYLTSDNLKAAEKLRALHTLDVSHNKMAEVDFIAAQFPDLEVLNVNNNRITRWQSVLSLHKCQCLSELNVNGNPFGEPDGEKPGYHQELQATLLTLEILDGALVKRQATSKHVPVMRPMSASSVVSARQVENQLRNADQDLSSFMASLSNRFENLRIALDTLPSEPPRQRPMTAFSDDLSIRSVSSMSDGRPGSRCNSRSRIANAKAFASQHF